MVIFEDKQKNMHSDIISPSVKTLPHKGIMADDIGDIQWMHYFLQKKE